MDEQGIAGAHVARYLQQVTPQDRWATSSRPYGTGVYRMFNALPRKKHGNRTRMWGGRESASDGAYAGEVKEKRQSSKQASSLLLVWPNENYCYTALPY